MLINGNASMCVLRYGFHRSTEPKGKVEPGVQMVEHFTQEHFCRGREDLLSHIHRKTSKLAGRPKADRKHPSMGSERERAHREEQTAVMQNVRLLSRSIAAQPSANRMSIVTCATVRSP